MSQWSHMINRYDKETNDRLLHRLGILSVSTNHYDNIVRALALERILQVRGVDPRISLMGVGFSLVSDKLQQAGPRGSRQVSLEHIDGWTPLESEQNMEPTEPTSEKLRILRHELELYNERISKSLKEIETINQGIATEVLRLEAMPTPYEFEDGTPSMVFLTKNGKPMVAIQQENGSWRILDTGEFTGYRNCSWDRITESADEGSLHAISELTAL